MAPVVLLCGTLLAGLASSPARAVDCAARGDMHYVCGPRNVEDILPLPGTDWLIASGLAGDEPGRLHLVNRADKSWRAVEPAVADTIAPAYQACPGPPDAAVFSAHGISLRTAGDGTATLYVVNHGGREAVEVYRVDLRAQAPRFTWTGCVVMPDGTYLNGVAALSEEGFVVTKMFDPGDTERGAKMAAGEPTGVVYEWRPDRGLRTIPGSDISGPNGIEVSPDGQWLYVAASGSRELIRLPRSGKGGTESVAVDFMPDNIRWDGEGRLIAAGPNPAPPGSDARFQGWSIVAWGVADMETRPLLSSADDSLFWAITVATPVDGTLWIGTPRGDRIGYIDRSALDE